MSAFKIPRGPIHEPTTAEMFDAALSRSVKIVHEGELVLADDKPQRVESGGIHPSWLP